MSGRPSIATLDHPDDMHARRPVDRVAARVIRPSSFATRYEPDKQVLQVCSAVPLPVRPQPVIHPNQIQEFADLTGVRFGRLVVVGYMGGGQWSCRCDCGRYVPRKSKAVKNPNNATLDRCEMCRHALHLKRTDYFRRTGTDLNREGEELR